jgi:hypothetical protein
MSATPRTAPELFQLEPPENGSKAYRTLYAPTSERAAQAKAYCEDMWRDFHDLADKQFVERFPFEFHQRWFEMYLGASLRRANLEVTAPKPGPDFRVVVEGRPVYIEAVAPTGGDPLHPDAVSEPVYKDSEGKPRAIQMPHAKITLRIADSFRRKADVFDRYRRDDRVGKGDPCIIAINLHDIPQAWSDSQEYWFRSLYGVGDMFITLDRAGHATTAGRKHRELLERASGAVEDVAPLLNPDRKEVSGVLGSAADAGNPLNILGDDFLLMPHSAAQAPYPRGLIKRGAEITLRPAEGGQQWDIETTDYGAHTPQGPIPFAVEFEGARHEGEWAVEGRSLSVRIASWNSTVPIRAGDDPATLAQENAIGILSVLLSRRR